MLLVVVDGCRRQFFLVVYFLSIVQSCRCFPQPCIYIIVAKAIGVKRDRLAKWETSLSRTPPIEGYAAIAEHYGVTIERLVFADLSYKEVPRYPESIAELWSAQRHIFPIAHSEEAMRIRTYREGYSALTSALKEQSSNVLSKLEKAEENFYKAYKESGSIEGACNYVITLIK